MTSAPNNSHHFALLLGLLEDCEKEDNEVIIILKIGPSGWDTDVLNEADWRNPAQLEHQPPKLMISNHSPARTCSGRIFVKAKGGIVTKSPQQYS